MALARKQTALLAFVPVAGEAACIAAAYAAAAWCSQSVESPFARELAANAYWLVTLLAVWYLHAIDQRLYVSRRSDALAPQLLSVTKAAVTAVLIAVFLVALFKRTGFNREFALIFCCLSLVSLILLRLLARLSLWGLRGRGFNHRRIVLIGANPRTALLVQTIQSHEHYGYHIAGFLDDERAREHYLEQYGVPYLGEIQVLERLLVDEVVDIVYITLPLRTNYETIQNIAHLCEGVGVSVRLAGGLFDLRTTACDVRWLDSIPLLSLTTPTIERHFDLRRFAEVVESSVLLIILAPFFFFIALWIKLDSPGPIFVRESRTQSRTQRRYQLLRFRTRQAAAQPGGEPAWTRAGRILHRYSLDELPQIINVWRGHLHPTAPNRQPLAEPAQDAVPAPETAAALPKTKAPRALPGSPALLLAALDAGGILGAFLASVYESLTWNETLSGEMLRHLPYLSIFLVLWYAAAIDQRLFGLWRTEGTAAYAFAVTKAVGSALVYCTLVMALLSSGIDRHFLLTFCLAAPIALLALRLAFYGGVSLAQHSGLLRRRVLLVGANERALHLAQLLRSRRPESCHIVGCIEDDPERAASLEAENVPLLGAIASLESVLTQQRVDDVYVCLPMRSSYAAVQHIVRVCEDAEVSLNLVADLFPLRVASRRLTYLEDIPLISLSTIPEAQVRLALKRLLDIAVSSALLVLLAPVFLAIGIVIKFQSPGPIFFAQERVGQNQRRFKMIKFRTMVANAEALRKELEALNEADGPVFKIRKDPRITRIGGFLRKHSIDEFPQLFNVWIGQMSLVGPRPPIASEVAQYTWGQRRRLSVRPGMTGLWQVSGRSDIGFEQWVELDLTYIDEWSLHLDLIILFKTYKEVFFGRGAA